MYCDKTSVNILTALLAASGLRDVVVCPGSRNAVLVHDFHECPALRCHPATDERSAAFQALGLTLASGRPAAVCVTSGSALLNVLPAVAEAAFRHLPLLIISADRPARWIGQLDGQTLPQPGALQPYAPSFVLPEEKGEAGDGWCARVVNEALQALTRGGGGPAHLNVPLDEPLFSFTTARLPACTVVREVRPVAPAPLPAEVVGKIRKARLPVLLLGERDAAPSPAAARLDAADALLVLPEIVANQPGSFRTMALELLPSLSGFQPDLVIHAGGALVNKRLKLHLRGLPHCHVIRIEESDALPDTFLHLDTVIRSPLEPVLAQLADALPPSAAVRRAKERLQLVARRTEAFVPAGFSDLGLMQLLARQAAGSDCSLHLANSSVVRNACYFFDGGRRPVFCNRGLNGIEGSLSTALGYAQLSPKPVLTLIGDLSFFYDQNALWREQLPPGLRILLFNNGGGQIFRQLPGLSASAAMPDLVAAAHHTSAEAVARSHGLAYFPVRDYAAAARAFDHLLAPAASRPVLVEAFTDAADNEHDRRGLLRLFADAENQDITNL